MFRRFAPARIRPDESRGFSRAILVDVSKSVDASTGPRAEAQRAPRKKPWVARCRIRRPAASVLNADSLAVDPVSTVAREGDGIATAEAVRSRVSYACQSVTTSFTSFREAGSGSKFSDWNSGHTDRVPRKDA